MKEHADRLNKLLTQITDEFMQSFDQAKGKAKPVENLAAAENQLKSIEKRTIWSGGLALARETR